MQKRQDISNPQAGGGMNSDLHPSRLKNGQYPFALNTNNESSDGGQPLLTNEPSNILCSTFKDGYKVIGVQRDIINNRTFFFLVNPDTNCSEIGYIPNINDITNQEDVEQNCNCEIKIKLATPLEDQVESEVCEYITLISDCEDCPENTVGNQCLNFNINYPISSEIHQEKCGAVIYFTDDLNPRRKIEVDNIDQYFIDEQECNESDVDCDCGKVEVPVCLNCEKFLLQKPFKVPCIDVKGLVNGGALKHGVYEFYIAYTDGNGNEVTRYMSVTGEVPVKNLNKNIYQQPELDAPTNYSIKLAIGNLDEDYQFYKIAVKQITSVDAAPSFFDVGTFPITANEVIYAGGENNLQRSSSNQIMKDYPIYTKAKTVEQFNNHLGFADLETIPEVNLQPVMNFAGQFLRWRTSVAEEDLYKNAEASAKFRSYLRDEVEPFAIRFLTKDGYVTANFPLIGRAKTLQDELFIGETNIEDQIAEINSLASADLDVLEPRTGWRRDVLSILKNSATDCTSDNRYYRWQYYNTAELTKTDLFERFNCADLQTEIDDIDLERTCVTTTDIVESDVDIELTEFDEGEGFTTLLDYVKNHQDDLVGVYDFLVTDSYSGENNPDIPCCTPTFLDSCDNITPVSDVVGFISIDESGATIVKKYLECGEENYPPNGIPDFCNLYKTNTEGNPVNLNPCNPDCEGDCDLIEPDFDPSCHPFICYVGYYGTTYQSNNNQVFERVNSVSGGKTCSSADEILYNVDIQVPAHIKPKFDFEGSLVTAKLADNTPDGSGCPTGAASRIRTYRCANPSVSSIVFSNTIHSNALWFKHSNIDVNETPFLILNVSKMTPAPADNLSKDCLLHADVLRISVYDSCSNDDAPLKTYCVDVLEDGKTICIDFSDPYFSSITGSKNTLYFAIDTPLVTIPDASGGTESEVCDGDAQYLTPTYGCFSLNMYSPAVSAVQITGDLVIRIRKACTYTAECTSRIIKEIKCDPVPFQEGKFAYWESILKYPDNPYLYDSSSLNVPSNFFDDVESEVATEFEETFTDGVEGDNYTLNENTDFRCKPIRHFKFPDNSISPITDGDTTFDSINPPFNKNKIYPIGIYLDNRIINKLLDLAVLNDLITQEFRDSITGYEIFKGDIRLNRSIIGKGLMYDMYKYQEENNVEDVNKDIWFSNFPYNDLRSNDLLWKNKAKDETIPHPFEGDRNIKFTFHSPEFSFDKPAIPFELKTEAYFLGNSRGKFTEVNGHPDMVLLGDKAYNWATALGTIEASLALISDITNQLIQISQASFAGLSTNWGQAVGWVGFGFFVAQRVINFTFVDIWQKRYEWLKAFYDNGTPYNFAAYYTSEGMYNSIVRADEQNLQGSLLRGIRARHYLNSGRYAFREDFEQLNINHYNRESAVFLSVSTQAREAHFALEHNPAYLTYDDSRTTSAAEGLCFDQQNETFDSNTTKTIYKNLYAPYVSLKNYVPAQHGDIDSVRWMTTHYCGNLEQDNSCDVIYGGETFLSRFHLKRKFPFFLNPMLIGDDALPDLVPFSYTEQRNVGFPVFFVDFNTDQSKNFGRFEMPDIKSYFNLDCYYEPKMYVKPPSKFYLYYYGIPSFIVESRVNLNYRHGENNSNKDFAPNQSDYVDWTQEKNVSIREDNYYFYNPIYSHDNDLYAYRILPFNYNPSEWNCQADHKDRVIYSLQDGQPKPANDFTDRWAVYLANNKNDFGNKFGDLFMIKNIEQQKVLALFSEGAAVFNAFSTLKTGEGRDLQTPTVGDGGIFATAPTDFFAPGYGGTQHRQFVSSEFGHFWVDAKRGRVYNLAAGGGGFDEISSNGMKNWFRENLPFTEVKKQFPNITDDALDNPYKDYGILLWWDSRFSRLFLTKKDYKLKDDATCCIEYREGIGFVQNTECSGTCELDLMFVIDVSGSIDSVEMALQKSFIKSILEQLRPDIESGKVKVGFATFNHTPVYTQTMLTGAGATDILTASIDTNVPNIGGGGTVINFGLCSAHQEFVANGRTGLPKKIITITDGLSLGTESIVVASDCSPYFDYQISNNAESVEADLNTLGYENIVVGIDPQDSSWNDFWNTIHNSTANNGNAYIASFLNLDNILEDLFEGVCTSVVPIDVQTSDCFEDCSWTVAYNPLTKSWISFYSFTPDYAVSFDNYFATGKNWGDHIGMYSHLLYNSFCVFYGEREPWKIQTPFIGGANTKFYQKLNYKLNAVRFTDTYEFIDVDYNFNEAVVFNMNKESTGRLKLRTAQKNNMHQYLQYPKYTTSGVEILATREQDIWEIGQLFDNAIKGRPLFKRPCSNADIEINENAYTYKSGYHNLLRSSGGGSVLFTEYEHSQVKFVFEWLIDEHTDY